MAQLTYRVRFTPAAIKQVRKLDPQIATRIKSFLEDRVNNTENPRLLGTALVGDTNIWRYRVQDYRILVSIEDETVTVLVLDVAHRREVYR